MTAATTPPRGLTWAEFLDLPGESRHAELVNGAVVVTTPSVLHQQVVGRLVTELNLWIREGTGRGEVTMDPAVQIAVDRGLVAEVLSPSTRRLDVLRKRDDYGRIGVRELWLVDPEVPEAMIARAPHDGPPGHLADEDDLDREGVLRSPLLPGFGVRLADLVDR